MKNLAILILLAIIAGLCISMFAESRYKAENPEVFEPEKDILCGIYTQQSANYYLLGQSTEKGNMLHLWFYPNGDKKIDENNVAREIFAIEVVIPKGDIKKWMVFLMQR